MVYIKAARIASLGTAAAVVGALVSVGVPPAQATTTASADDARTGWDRNEPGLSPANVVSSDFGQLFTAQLDGQVYAQPIVVPAANGRSSATLVAVTENDTVYGLDPVSGAIRWHRHVGQPWTVANPDVSCPDLAPVMGASATPVYDPATDSVFFTAKVDDGGNNQTPNFYVYAVDPGSGADRHARTLIQGAPSNFPGTSFQAYFQNSRPGLLLMQGTVYTAFGSICDLGPYRGWVAGVDAASGALSALWTTENTGTYSGGGIWQAGGGITSDGAGRMFVSTGNGLSPARGPGKPAAGNLAESVIRLQVNADKSLSAADFFAPANADSLDVNDQDLGSGGPVALPDSFGAGTTVPHLMVQVGKDGRVFLLNRDDLGGRGQGPDGTDAAVQVVGPYPGIWGHPAAWDGDKLGRYVYTVGNGDVLRAFRAGKDASGTPSLSMAGASTDVYWFTSGSPIVTSDGQKPGSATVWVVDSSGGTGANSVLNAYNAVPDATGTLQKIGSWPIGTAAKFTIAGTDSNRVYIGTRDGTVLGFGRPATSALTGPSTDFGKLEVGSPGTTLNVTLTAQKTVTINSLTMSNPVYTTPALSAPITLTAGQTTTLPVTFTPTAPGATWGILTANATVGGVAGRYSVGLSGTGTHSGLAASPSPVRFTTDDPQPTGTTRTIAVRITNTGTEAETLGTATLGNDPTNAFSVKGLPAAGTVIAPQTGIDISVSYSPTAAGTQNASITIPDSTGTLVVPLSGTSIVAVRSISVTPQPLDFGSVAVGQSGTRTLTVTNTGNVPATITKAKAPNGGGFSVAVPINEGTMIPVGQSVDVQVTFAPTAAGPATGTYEITSDTGQGAMYVPVKGTTVSQFAASPSPVSFPAGGGAGQPVGTTATTTVHITNDGPAPETFQGLTGPSGSGPFSVGGGPANGTVVPPGGGFDLTVAYHPTAAGTQTGVIIVNDAGDPLTIPVSGTAAGESTDPNPAGPTGPAVSRLSGGDRYATGVAVSQAQWAAAGGDASGRGRAQEVVLARGDQFPDALAGVPLAAAVKGPLLLTDPKTLTPDTEKEIQRVLPRGGTVNVLGLSGAVSDAVAGRLTQLGYHVVRHGGADRYATARAIAAKLHPAKVILATGQDYADALSAGPFATGPAATGGVPAAILLTEGKTLDPETAGLVKSIAASSTAAAPTVFAVGGQAATAAGHLGGYVRSFSGADRYATDAMVVSAIAAASPLTHLGIATGLGFPDALTGGAFTASQGGALVIIPSALGPDTTHLLNALAPRLTTVSMFGGENVVSAAVAGQITAAVGGRPQ